MPPDVSPTTNAQALERFRGSQSVLVVDDNAAMKYSMARQLRASGYRTVEASGGAEALELSEFVSAVVLDMHLPDVDGLEVCRLLRARPATARLPVIHVSAVGMEPDDAMAAAKAGADDFLVAPVDGGLLTLTLDRLLVARHAPVATAAPMRGSRSGAGVDSIFDEMMIDEKTRDVR